MHTRMHAEAHRHTDRHAYMRTIRTYAYRRVRTAFHIHPLPSIPPHVSLSLPYLPSLHSLPPSLSLPSSLPAPTHYHLHPLACVRRHRCLSARLCMYMLVSERKQEACVVAGLCIPVFTSHSFVDCAGFFCNQIANQAGYGSTCSRRVLS